MLPEMIFTIIGAGTVGASIAYTLAARDLASDILLIDINEANFDAGDVVVAVNKDGKAYAVPVNGFWEAMFVNTEVLEAAGVEMPGADYTMEMFKADLKQFELANLLSMHERNIK